MKGRRIELNAMNGLRVWATFFMVLGRAVESLWIDSSGQSNWLDIYACSTLRRMADDLVCFYFVLSGFTIAWGYQSRDFESSSVKYRYWIGRIERFYPDFFISSVVTIIGTVFVGCQPLYPLDLVFNIAQLLLVGGWLAWLPYPSVGNLNGPVWFIVALDCIWILFPWLVRPVRAAFHRDAAPAFLAKLAALWLLSLAPWALLLSLRGSYAALGYRSYEEALWAFKAFPLFRLPEFLIGMAVALRVRDASADAAAGPHRA
eukprot:CAMPEP_0172189302 /NCGR_PEP_ID=MMETSP1050-20130122/22442_1 /TAXON_ID=233186 /ORGANISM="Cryptomonas curvata, Strain CCAP979/52" /LENGTH=259 /DNA_ID=CAMNT_0012863969 /DNA_START=67 /DNA_END=842 /DNA_ORIENTATION=-